MGQQVSEEVQDKYFQIVASVTEISDAIASMKQTISDYQLDLIKKKYYTNRFDKQICEKFKTDNAGLFEKIGLSWNDFEIDNKKACDILQEFLEEKQKLLTAFEDSLLDCHIKFNQLKYIVTHLQQNKNLFNSIKKCLAQKNKTIPELFTHIQHQVNYFYEKLKKLLGEIRTLVNARTFDELKKYSSMVSENKEICETLAEEIDWSYTTKCLDQLMSQKI